MPSRPANLRSSIPACAPCTSMLTDSGSRGHCAGLFSPLGRALGMQDIEIGDAEFDRVFVLKGNDEAKVRQFFCRRHAQGAAVRPVADPDGGEG